MELFEYIKSQLPQMPNSAIMKQMGASEELIDYVKETPWNTNLNVMGSIADSGGGADAEVWLTGTLGECQNGYARATLTETDKADIDGLCATPSNYSVYFNETEMFLLTEQRTEDTYIRLAYGNTNDLSTTTFAITITKEVYDEEIILTLQASTKCPTDITSVEISVKAK